MTVRLLVFACLSAALAWVSRASLGAPRSHGFYRFLAWECMLALLLLNFVSLEQWFAEPLSARQLASWALLVICIVPVVLGVHQLRTAGRPVRARADDAPLLAFEKTTRLVTSGVYRYVRHPLYCSLLLLAWGVFLKRPSWIAGALALAATAFLAATAKVEEGENVRFFGPEYAAYQQRTKRFIPLIW